jgi:hypothetical protein
MTLVAVADISTDSVGQAMASAERPKRARIRRIESKTTDG